MVRCVQNTNCRYINVRPVESQLQNCSLPFKSELTTFLLSAMIPRLSTISTIFPFLNWFFSFKVSLGWCLIHFADRKTSTSQSNHSGQSKLLNPNNASSTWRVTSAKGGETRANKSRSWNTYSLNPRFLETLDHSNQKPFPLDLLHSNTVVVLPISRALDYSNSRRLEVRLNQGNYLQIVRVETVP